MKILNASIAVCSVAIMLFFTQCRKDNTPAVPINKAPIANANNPVTNMPKDSVELDGSGSVDPDGDPITYKWTYISGSDSFIIRKNTDAKTFVAKLKVGTYKFLLTVTDNKGAFSIDTATVIVNPTGTNQPPTANANNPVTNMPKDSVELDGSGSIDPDGDPITYKWAYISGPDGSVIRKDTDAKTFVAKLKEGTYKFLLTVTDSKMASATANVIVIVNPASVNPPIVITLSPSSQTKNLSVVGNPILKASATGGRGTITYTWSNESRPTGAAIPTITAPNKDSTTVTGINAVGTYTFKVIATDADGKTSSAIATIITSNVEPKIIGSFAGYYSGNSANTFKFNITPDVANTAVDVVVGGATPYNNNKTTYTYVLGMAGAVDTLKNCSSTITAADGSTSTASFMGIFSTDYKTLTIKDFKLGEGLSSFADFTLTKL